jgi:hypothetical protein
MSVLQIYEQLQLMQATHQLLSSAGLGAVLSCWRTPPEASLYLWDKFRVKRNPRRLAQLRASGEGPKFHRDGCVVRYHSDNLDAYGELVLGEPATSTSEENARRALVSAEPHEAEAVGK